MFEINSNIEIWCLASPSLKTDLIRISCRKKEQNTFFLNWDFPKRKLALSGHENWQNFPQIIEIY